MRDDRLQVWLKLALKTLKTRCLEYAFIPPVFVLVFLKLYDAQYGTHPILQSLTFSIIGLCCLASCSAVAFSAFWSCSPLRAINLVMPRLFRSLLPCGLLILVTVITITYFIVDKALEYSSSYPAWIWASVIPWVLVTGLGSTYTPNACVYGDKYGSNIDRAKTLSAALPNEFTSVLMFGGLLFAIYPVAFFLVMPLMACLMVSVFIDVAPPPKENGPSISA